MASGKHYVVGENWKRAGGGDKRGSGAKEEARLDSIICGKGCEEETEKMGGRGGGTGRERGCLLLPERDRGKGSVARMKDSGMDNGMGTKQRRRVCAALKSALIFALIGHKAGKGVRIV